MVDDHVATSPTASEPPKPAKRRRRSGRIRHRGSAARRLRWVVLAVAAVALVSAVVTAASVSLSWRNLERETLDTSLFDALPAVDHATREEQLRTDRTASTPSSPPASDNLRSQQAPNDALPLSPETVTVTDTVTDTDTDTDTDTRLLAAEDLSLAELFTTFMVVGSDVGGRRADVIIVVLLPNDDSPPIMVSLPRDLYLPNRCTGGLTRINANYNGCGPEINGVSLLSGAVQDFTGLRVDHFVSFTMDGFENVIDAVGGVEICVDRPTRERDRFELPAGCTIADGAQTLGWVRSRRTQVFVDGSWKTMPGVSDFSRNARQQDLLVLLAEQVASFTSPQDLTRFAASLEGSFVLDDRLTLSAAADLAWSHRDIDPELIRRPKIPVRDHVTAGGAQVLVPTASFADVIRSTPPSGAAD